MSAIAQRRMLRIFLSIAAFVLVAWIRTLPLGLPALDRYAGRIAPHSGSLLAARLKAPLEYRGDDGRDHPYLGDFDSYYWLRMARNLIASGRACDAVVNGECRDTLARAPVGRRNLYYHSIHVYAIAALYALATRLRPGYPLPAAAFLVPVIVGALAILPAFAIGLRMGGTVGGLCAALFIGLNPLFLQRTFGADNDVWNIALPLCMVWALIKSLEAHRTAATCAFVLAAAILAAIHAATWSGWIFAYDAALLGMLIHAAGLAARDGAASRNWRPWKSLDFKRTAGVALGFAAATALAIALIGGPAPALAFSPLRQLAAWPASHRIAPASPWPEVLGAHELVVEAAPKKLDAVVKYLGGRCFFLAACLGLLIAVLPRARGNRTSLVLLAVGGIAAAAMLRIGTAPPLMVLAVVIAPLGGAMLIGSFTAASADETRGAMGWIVAVWFVAALALSFKGERFVMLAVAPFGLALAAAAGESFRLLASLIESAAPTRVGLARAAALALTVAPLAIPVWQGYAAACNYVPEMNGAWWNTLARIREQSPPNAIIDTWWDYGYWAEYVAARRTAADGGALRTHIPFWIAQALMAPSPRQSAGLLRMLNCGSDTSPGPGRREGAVGKLRADGIGQVEAADIVTVLAGLDRGQADAYLELRGLNRPAREDVLASTHCAPPPSYLVLSSAMNAMPAWRWMGAWNPHDRGDSAAGALKSPGYVVADWIPCAQSPGSDEICFMGFEGTGLGPGVNLEAVAVDPRDPARTRLRMRGHHGARLTYEVSPALILIAASPGLRAVACTRGPCADLGVLVDPGKHRVLVGTPALIRSTYTRLMFLGGHYARLFHQIDDRRGYGGERVVAWRIDWDALADQ